LANAKKTWPTTKRNGKSQRVNNTKASETKTKNERHQKITGEKLKLEKAE